VVIKSDGLLEQHDVQSMLGIDLALCNEPTRLANVTAFSVQLLCQGLGYQPEAGVALGDELVTIRDLNNNFRCSETSLHLEANDLQEVVDFYNHVLTVATCKKVGGMDICGIESRKEAGWVTVQLHVCTEEGKHIHIFRPYETLHGIAVDVKENSTLAEIHDLVKPFEYHNALVFVPKAFLPTVVDLFKWSSAKNAVSGQGDLSNLRKLWRNLCGNHKSQEDVFSCDEITGQMVVLCEKYRSGDDKRKVQKLKTCLEKMHPGDTTKQAEVMHNENKKLCEVLGVQWTTPTELHECMEKEEKTVWVQFGELMTRVKDNVFCFVQVTWDAISYVNSWVDFVWGYSWKIISIIWANKETAMFSTAWGLILAVYKFSGKLEKDAPGSSSIWNSIKHYGFRCLLSPMSFVRGVKKDHTAIISKKVHSSLSQGNFPTKDHVSSYVNEKLSSYVNDEKLRENNEATKQSYTEVVENYLSRRQIPDTEFVESLIQKGLSQNREKTAQFCGNSLRQLMAEEREKMNSVLQRSIATILSDQNESVQGPESDRDVMAKVLNPRRLPIAENRQAGNAERWRGCRR